MKIYALTAFFLAAAGLSGCVTSEDYGFRHASTDCSSEGRQKPLSNDSGAGISWTIPNTARWCAPRGGMPVGDDPVFAGSN